MHLGYTIPMFALCISGCVLKTPSLVARTPSLRSGPAPEPADTRAIGDDQIIEAGCSFAGNDIKGEPGSVHELLCPAGCEKDVAIFGTDVYSAGSPVCPAAMHAGLVSEQGGQVTVVLEGPRPAFRGSKRNGIESRDWSADRGSYRFEGVALVASPPPPVAASRVIEAGCSFTANEIRGDAGSAHRVSCPAGCNEGNPLIWGSDTYTGHSRICVAAIHAGLATDQGGQFTLILEDSRPAYRGSKRNGVASRDHGAYRASFQLKR
jgi:hypothetical protein